MIIVMLGAPGAGKGTQAKRIAAQFSLPHVSTGDIFRANMKEGTPLGLEAKRYIEAGELVPDALTVDMLLGRLAEADCEKGCVLDGFPRTIPQAEALDGALQKSGKQVDLAIDVEVPDESIVERMAGRRSCPKCGAVYHLVYNAPAREGVCDTCGAPLVQRDDDKPETVSERLQVYHAQTAPLTRYYKERGVLHGVDGTRAPEEVTDFIFSILKGAGA